MMMNRDCTSSSLSFAHFGWCCMFVILFLAFYIFRIAALCHILQIFSLALHLPFICLRYLFLNTKEFLPFKKFRLILFMVSTLLSHLMGSSTQITFLLVLSWFHFSHLFLFIWGLFWCNMWSEITFLLFP